MAQMTPAQRFLMMTQGRQPRPVANMLQQYKPPGMSVPPPMSLRRPQPPAPAMPAAPRMSPMMQRVAQQAAMPRMTPPTGAVTPPPTTPPAGGQPSGFMGAFSQPLTSPVGQAISQAAIAGARASDWSPTPVSLGRVLAEMGAAATGGYQAGLKEERAAEAADFARRMQLMQFAQKEREIAGTLGKEGFANEKQLRSEFDKQAKTFDEARLGFEKVQKAAMSDKPTGATDIALIFGYMKVIDPTSVVREGEFATAENAGGIGARVRNMYNKVVRGERLTQDTREDFVQAARTQFQPYLDMQTNVENRYTNLSEAYGLDPKKVVLSRLPKTGTLANPYTTFATEADAEAANLPKGTYVMIGGQLFVEE